MARAAVNAAAAFSGDSWRLACTARSVLGAGRRTDFLTPVDLQAYSQADGRRITRGWFLPYSTRDRFEHRNVCPRHLVPADESLFEQDGSTGAEGGAIR